MIKRIELKNFMSHEHTVLDLADGLTVLIGPNNVGKSAIIAALQILCYNDNSTYVMRHGTKHCSVTVETDDEHVITWQRKTSPSYIIDGETFDRLGRGAVPDELHQVLKLPKVDNQSGDAFDIHFGSQKSPIFLLDQSGASAARFFASSSDAIRLVAMQQKHKEHVRDARKERTRLDAESKLLNAELAALDPVIDIERKVELLEKEFAALEQLEQQIQSLSSLHEFLCRQTAVVSKYEDETATLIELSTPPEMYDVFQFESLLRNMQTTQQICRQETSFQESLVALAAPPLLLETDSLSNLIGNLSSTFTIVDQESKRTERLQTLSSPPAIGETTLLQDLQLKMIAADQDQSRLEAQAALLDELAILEQADEQPLQLLVHSIEAASQEFQRLQQASESLTKLAALEEIDDLSGLVSDIDEIQRSQKQVAEFNVQVEKLQKEITEFTDELNQTFSDQKCPVCGGVIDAACLLEQANAVGARE